MNATKLYDLVVKTGEYTNRNGETKARYENIGAVMRNDKGSFAMIKRTFNPAGVPGDRDSILVSMFEPRQENRQDAARQAPQGEPADFGGDAIPFAPQVL